MQEMLDEDDFLDDQQMYAKIIKNQDERDEKILGTKVISPAS